MKPVEDEDRGMRPHYDFSKGIRGRYAARHAKGSNVVVLEPDVAAQFPTAEAVDDALKEVIARRRIVL